MHGIGTPKSKISNPNKIPTPKSKNLKHLVIGKLEFDWKLVLGNWKFHCCAVGVPLDPESNFGAR
jgi:hypothetical protein